MIRNSSRTGGSVVVPALSAPSSVAVCRSLGRRGIGVIVATESAGAAAARSRYCKETVRVPSPGTDFEGYAGALCSLAARPDVRAVLPVREEDVYALAMYRDTFAEHVEPLWPEAATLQRVQDRLQLFDIAEQAGVAIPETGMIDEWDRWDRPTIVKARYSLLAKEYVASHPAGTVDPVPKTAFLDPETEPDHEALTARMGHVPIAQEYINNGNEYGFFALYDEGEAVATFQHRQLRGYHYCGGPSAHRESVAIPELEHAGRDLLDALDWHGLAMVEFLRDEETGEFRLMEVNPRLWSSLPFSVQAGGDFPYYCWQLATGTRAAIDSTYESGIGGHLLRGEAIHLYSVLREEYPLVTRPRFGKALADIASSIIRHPRFDYLVADDPLPFVYDLREAAASVFSNGVEPERSPDSDGLPVESDIEAGTERGHGDEPFRPIPDGGPRTGRERNSDGRDDGETSDAERELIN